MLAIKRARGGFYDEICIDCRALRVEGSTRWMLSQNY